MKYRQLVANLAENRITKTFLRISATTNLVANEELMRVLEATGYNFLPNKVREFSLKFYSNILGTNDRLKHYVINNDGNCQFCKINSRGPIYPPETFKHLFWDCKTTTSYRKAFWAIAFPELNEFLLDIDNEKKLWYYGILNRNNNKNYFIVVALIMFKWIIWRTKLFKQKRSFWALFELFYEELDRILKHTKRLEMEKNKLEYAICRNWDILINRRG